MACFKDLAFMVEPEKDTESNDEEVRNLNRMTDMNTKFIVYVN